MQRVHVWSAQRLGLALNAATFNTFIVSVLAFASQLCPVIPHLLECVDQAMRKLAACPGNWVLFTDLQTLSAFGFHTDFRCISTIARAAKLRVTHDFV